MNIPTEVHASETEVKINNTEPETKFYENISTYSTKEEITNSKLCASAPLEKEESPELSKPRSFSDGTLKSTPIVTETLAKEDSDLTKVDVNQSKPKRNEILKTILNMLPNEFTNKRQNSVHPAAPNTSSEDSGISVDNSVPVHKTVEQDEPSDEESEDSSETTRRLGSSVLSLKGLFGGSSSQSSSSTHKEIRLSPKDEMETRPQSLTSGSSSAGYENLAFVPMEILSRRSSIFSDASC